jgi:hypothetical protein
MRTCKKCGVGKPLDQFRVDRGYLRGACRECEHTVLRAYQLANLEKGAEASRKWSREHPAQRNATKRAWRVAHPEQQAAMRRAQNYGITSDKYAMILVSQGGVCAVCRGECKTGRRLAVDHCHLTKGIRGLLCNRCNHLLGLAGDASDILRAAAEYLEMPRAC